MMTSRKSVINIGLLGLGTVGTGVMQILAKNRADIAAKTGSELKITKALVRDQQNPPPSRPCRGADNRCQFCANRSRH